MDGDQRGGTGGIDGNARPAQIEMIRKAMGGHAQGVAGGDIRIGGQAPREQQPSIIAGGNADKDARVGTGKTIGSHAGLLQCLPGDLQQQAVLRIEGDGLPRRDAKERGVEIVDVCEKAALGRDFFKGGTRPMSDGDSADHAAAPRRSRQNSSGLSASGKRQPRPMIAIGSDAVAASLVGRLS